MNPGGIKNKYTVARTAHAYRALLT